VTEERQASGSVLGRYIVVDELGHGGMGVVYKAYDPKLDRMVAVKLLRPRDGAPREQERMLREGQAMARLAHPNVVAVYDVGAYDDRIFVAMELVEGDTLRAWLKNEHPWRATVAMFLQAARGLAAAHAVGIVHRDFKPENAIVGTDGRVRVLDFGLAREREDGDREIPSSDGFSSTTTETQSALAMVGTPRYMALEQIDGAVVDAAADQYAFTVSLWEALYGESP
jgi:serine/threonine protein kinase